MTHILLAVALLLGTAHAVQAQSFDCKKAQSRVEKLICGNDTLKELDEYLGRYYAAGRAELGEAASCLESDQAQWLKSTRDACMDAACLESAYLNRLSELDALQPGATALKNLTLPHAPALVWIVPPAGDKVAAPPKPNARPFEATGVVVNEVATGDGFMLQTKEGAKIPLVLAMFVDGPTQPRLEALAQEKNANYRARGFAASDGKRTYFEPSRCTFIHRMPATVAGDDQDGLQELETVRTHIVTQGKVCPDPNKPCPGFAANELSFAIGQPFKFDRGRDKSQPFYAVILKSGSLCGINDAERLAAQKHFPAAKVFVHRHMCDGFSDKVTYSNVNEKSGFVAVYAGETNADAKKVLVQAVAAGFKGANVRRMEVIVVYQIE